jgi:hypothetical protein
MLFDLFRSLDKPCLFGQRLGIEKLYAIAGESLGSPGIATIDGKPAIA